MSLRACVSPSSVHLFRPPVSLATHAEDEEPSSACLRTRAGRVNPGYHFGYVPSTACSCTAADALRVGNSARREVEVPHPRDHRELRQRSAPQLQLLTLLSSVSASLCRAPAQSLRSTCQNATITPSQASRQPGNKQVKFCNARPSWLWTGAHAVPADHGDNDWGKLSLHLNCSTYAPIAKSRVAKSGLEPLAASLAIVRQPLKR